MRAALIMAALLVASPAQASTRLIIIEAYAKTLTKEQVEYAKRCLRRRP